MAVRIAVVTPKMKQIILSLAGHYSLKAPKTAAMKQAAHNLKGMFY